MISHLKGERSPMEKVFHSFYSRESNKNKNLKKNNRQILALKWPLPAMADLPMGRVDLLYHTEKASSIFVYISLVSSVGREM